MNRKSVTAQALLTAMLAIAGLTPKTALNLELSECESRDILSLIAGSEHTQIIELLEHSQSRELNASEAQILHTFTSKGALLLAAGTKPMY